MIDNMLRGILFGGLLALVAAVVALVLANTSSAPPRVVRAGDPGYTPAITESDLAAYTPTIPEALPQPVRTDIPPGMLPVPVETEQALATRQAEFAPFATQTAVATLTMQAQFGPYATQTMLAVKQLTATTLPQADAPPTGSPVPQP